MKNIRIFDGYEKRSRFQSRLHAYKLVCPTLCVTYDPFADH